MLRRLFSRVGWFGVSQLAWRHRGTLLRTFDAARRLPENIRAGETDSSLTELRAVATLARDRSFAKRTDVRIAGVEDGRIELRGSDAAIDPSVAQKLLGVAGVVEVEGATGSPRRDPGSTLVGEHPNRVDLTGSAPTIAPLDEAPTARAQA